MMRNLLICFTAGAILWSGCRPEPEGNLRLDVNIRHDYSDDPLSEIELELERRVLTNGVLNGNYESVTQASTDVSGNASLTFQRVNALDYQLHGSGNDWFSWSIWINPDDFLAQEIIALDHHMTPSAQVVIRLMNANPLDENDVISFRTLNIPGDYPTCSNAWENHSGMDVDVTRSCWIEADRYLPYAYSVNRNGSWTETVDSLWIDQGELASLEIAW